MSKYLSIIGTLITLSYSVALFFLIKGRADNIYTMPLNELGDFLAGAFGPLAIFWLILGFFQQGIELRQNTSALELQAKELKNSVEQQKELVNVSKNQFNASLDSLNYERELQRKKQLPIFIVAPSVFSVSGGKRTFSFSIVNKGQPVKDVEITINPKMELSLSAQPFWAQNTSLGCSIEFINEIEEQPSELTISYIDSLEKRGEDKFKLIFYSNKLNIEKIQS